MFTSTVDIVLGNFRKIFGYEAAPNSVEIIKLDGLQIDLIRGNLEYFYFENESDTVLV